MRSEKPPLVSLRNLGEWPLLSGMAQGLARLGLAAYDVQSVDALDQHFHQVVVGRGRSGAPVIANIKLTPLVTLAEELGRTVTPVTPTSRFRQDLGVALTDAHRQRMAQRTLGTNPSPPRRDGISPRPWLIGLVAALFLMLVWRRKRKAAKG